TVCKLMSLYCDRAFMINKELVKNVQFCLWYISLAAANVVVPASMKTELLEGIILSQYLPMLFFLFIFVSSLIDIGFSTLLVSFLAYPLLIKLILLSLAKSFKSRLIVIVETLNSFASSFELTSSLILISSIIIFCLFIQFISCLL